MGRPQPLAWDAWPEAARTHAGAALLLALVDVETATVTEATVTLAHAAVATLAPHELASLNLPPAAPLTLFLSRSAPISDPAFRLRVEWFRRGGGVIHAVTRLGSRLEADGQAYTLGEPLFSLLEAIATLNASCGNTGPEGLDQRMSAYAAFQSQLVRATGDVRADDYLKGLSIHHATGLGLDLTQDSHAAIMPTLYGHRAVDAATEANETVELQHETLLPVVQTQRFQQRFADQGGRRHYTLGSGAYLVLDAPVTAALAVISHVNRTGKAARTAFLRDPLALLMPAIEAAGGDGAILCDLKGYGERVIGIGPWEQAKLNFRLPVERRWFPEEELESFILAIGAEPPLVIRREEVAEL